ncbi:uncharacterized protein LOC116303878, partial [Actinia tenebrosa]|uniref:Uncharacterized protein LOC116303878 n=1 Tax=Actinia tenebrosa TaxID=6105 RepID=A0A6P8IR15_ACTTE
MSKVVMRRNLEGDDKLEMVTDDQLIRTSQISFSENNHPRRFWPVVVIACLLFIGGLVCILVATFKSPSSCPATNKAVSSKKEACLFSPEAKRFDLEGFLKEVQKKYYEMNPDSVAWQPDIEDQSQHVRALYVPYDPTPETLKKRTDAAKKLYDEISSMKIDMDKLKPREGKAVAQVKHFLKHTFGVPYEENYYAGDWMLGPNLFCWMAICNIDYDVNAFAYHFQPVTYDDVEHVIKTISKYKQSIDQYRSNVALGVTTGMIRTKIDCIAGVDALKQAFLKISLANDSIGVLQEWFTKLYLQKKYLSKLENGVEDSWANKHPGRNISTSIREALIYGIGQPMTDLLNYLEFDHMRHCLPNDVASGLGGLPVDYVYTDSKPDWKNRTTKTLPTGEVLNGTETYRMILSYFTTTDISPEEIYEEGMKQLDEFYTEIKKITKIYTKKSNESEAILEFKKTLNSSVMWHNNGSFPSNESDGNAFKKCVSPETAQKYCPVRWAAIQRWASYCREVMGLLYPKITKLFYFAGEKNTAPNCPVEMLPHYNPSNGAQFFRQSDSQCSKPTYFGLPFFLKDYGPVFQEWSVTAHEARPGHHTQVQGLKEHFQDSCGGVPSWLDSKTYYTAFTEGWGLYSENPLISDDTDTYEENLLQKYGMLKWQAWRAVRLIVDTGLHARN